MPALMHRSPATVFLSLLILCAISAKTQAQQPFVHGSDVLFRIRIDRKAYNIGDQITIRYTIKNVSNGALYVPRSQWEVKCGNPPHLWSRLEDSSGKHYEPGYAGSCLGPSLTDRMTLPERMQRDAVLLRPGQEATGSFSFDSKIFLDQLRPGVYRLEAVLYGWNLPFDSNQLHDLAGMGTPFLIGGSDAVSQVELLSGGK
ncbi:MAG TPA: hypothetical protein VMO80_06595 [Terriglobales bacterium]|nr:hypothetical protein [Terriglobales bacterium]